MIFSGQEVHPFGSPPQEDPRHPQGPDPSRGLPHDPQGDPKAEGFPHEEVRRQGLSLFFAKKMFFETSKIPFKFNQRLLSF